MGNSYTVTWMCGKEIIQEVYRGESLLKAILAYLKARKNKPEGAYYIEFMDRSFN
ncbi:hypothetical protein SM033_00017 [Vibrio phage vB_VpaM_sm033]|nr:hypothetical protein SM033_00017 [Vibrio phage vB_VpaM_sm033]